MKTLNDEVKKRIGNIVEIAVILILCGVTILLDFLKITYVENELWNKFLSKIVQQGSGILAVILLMRRLKIKLFGIPQQWLYLIPCLIVAIDNFQWSSFLSGRMELVHNSPVDFLLFGGYCLSVGMFEECIFRGIIFSVLAGWFSKDKRGLWQTYILSSLIFAAAHLLNGFSLGTIMQVGYTFLTGGLFGFVLLKNKNLLCCGFVHALYNFCGLLFETSARMGLGNGVVFDVGTVITMTIVSVLAGLFVLRSVYRYSDEERGILYKKLGISETK